MTTEDNEQWHKDNATDSVCEYAETALAHYMKENIALREEISHLKGYIKQLLWMAQEHD